ncbi:MAG TPA: cell division topological specificity factor MinE [Syntrophomonadaceae bacterium]|jgi:cell division topological specificity factor|nr:cell division topological specificity factor MinE [Syntrophomonadaceae bacterium]
MMDFLSRLFAKPESSSRNQANDRLRVVLTSDRMNASSQTLDIIKEEIINVICQHVEVDGTPEVNFVSEGRHSALDISIPIKSR